VTAGASSAPAEQPVGPGSPTGLRLELTRDFEAPADARAAVMGHCENLGLNNAACRTLMLLVSEVVSNAVLHSRGPGDAPIILTVAVTEHTIRITVTDLGGRGLTPKARHRKGAGGGVGLYLLDTEASRWGVEPARGTRVWFELPRSASPPQSRLPLRPAQAVSRSAPPVMCRPAAGRR
jgi:anti-sigma regulatory factor (Ser/Thr protein kinase)